MASAHHTSTHRFPYTGEEFVAFVLAGSLAAGVTALLADTHRWAAAAIAFVIFAGWTVLVSARRKRRSQVTVSLEGHALQVRSNGNVGDHDVSLEDVRFVNVREVQHTESLVLRSADESLGHLPVRVLEDRDLRDLLRAGLSHAEVSKSARKALA